MLYEPRKPLARSSLTLKQSIAVTRLTLDDNTLLIAPVGFGKAITGLTAACDRLNQGAVKRVLVIAPLRVAALVWRQEADKWDHIRQPVVAAIGDPKQRAAAIEGGAPIVVTNLENVPWVIKNYPDEFDGMVFDEIAKGKSVGGTLGRAMRPWVKKLRWRVGMSATPAAESGTDLYGQCLLLDCGASLGTRKEAFLIKYFQPTDYERRNWQLVRPDLLAQDIRGLVHFVDDSDYAASLPELVYVEHVISMPLLARSHYDEMAEKHVCMGVLAGGAGILAGKLRQMASGGLYGGDGKVVWYDPFRTDVAINLIQGMDTPIVVVYEFTFQLEALRAAFPDAPVLGDGQKFTGDDQDHWNSGAVPVLFMHVKSAAHGLNLQYGGHTLLVLTPVWGADPWQQVIGRLRRRGQPSGTVTVHQLLAFNTEDMKYRMRLDEKAAAEEEFNALLKA